MTQIAQNSLRMRASILFEMIAVIEIIMLGVMLFQTLKGQNRKLALLAVGLYLLTAAIIAVSRISSFSLLQTSQDSLRAGHPLEVQILGNLFFALQEWGYFLHMLPDTLGATFFYFLFYKSGFLPKFLSIWGLVAAPLALIGSVFDHLGVSIPMIVFLPNLPFGFGVGIWLMGGHQG